MARSPVPLLVGVGLLGALVALTSSNQSSAAPRPRPQGPYVGPWPEGLDAGSIAHLRTLHPDAAAAFVEVWRRAAAEGLAFKITSSKRDCATQNKLYAQGRTAPGPIVTHARGCQSWHVAGRAIDVSIAAGNTPANLARVGQLAKDAGGQWGGDFAGFYDPGHLEYHPGLTLRDVCPDPDHC